MCLVASLLTTAFCAGLGGGSTQQQLKHSPTFTPEHPISWIAGVFLLHELLTTLVEISDITLTDGS